jgi:hypothetical protein
MRLYAMRLPPMLPRFSAPDVLSAPPGSFQIRGTSATAADLFARSQREFELVDQIEALNRAIALAPNYQKAYSERAWLYKSERCPETRPNFSRSTAQSRDDLGRAG